MMGRAAEARGSWRTWRTWETRASRESGVALITALLLMSILSAIALSLSLVSAVDPMAAANQREAMATLYVARAGLELAAHELGAVSSWDGWLSGAATSALVDGAASGVRTTPSGESIDIGRLTNQLLCGGAAPCRDPAAITRDRPWGINNARWRPFIYGSSSHLGLSAASAHHYLIVWLGDDGGERDGRPGWDGVDGEGGGVVRVVAQAFGPFRSRQSLEARLSRRCEILDEVRVCGPGMRMDGVRVRSP
jgi:hypothetical protein